MGFTSRHGRSKAGAAAAARHSSTPHSTRERAAPAGRKAKLSHPSLQKQLQPLSFGASRRGPNGAQELRWLQASTPPTPSLPAKMAGLAGGMKKHQAQREEQTMPDASDTSLKMAEVVAAMPKQHLHVCCRNWSHHDYHASALRASQPGSA